LDSKEVEKMLNNKEIGEKEESEDDDAKEHSISLIKIIMKKFAKEYEEYALRSYNILLPLLKNDYRYSTEATGAMRVCFRRISES